MPLRVPSWMIFRAAIFCFCGLLTSDAFAQKEKADPAAKLPLKVPVWVEQTQGKFWLEGKRQSFKLFVEEKEVPLKSFQGPRAPTILLVVFDTVVDLARVDEARRLLGERIAALAPNYWVGLLRSQDGLSVLQEPTADRKLVTEKIQSVQVSGKAGLLDALEPVAGLATGMLRKAGVRIAVLYVTDSGIANYRADYLNPVINASDAGDLSRRFSDRAVQEQMSRLAKSLAKFTPPIFILHLEQRSDTMNLAYQSGLERIASASGGAAIFCRTNDEIKPSLAALFTQIDAAYFLGFDPPAGKSGAKLRVEARDATGQPLERTTHRPQVTTERK
ncbi:MAG: hypothetical protein ACKVX9_04875 [Blastocatellia bacterium]